MRYFHEISPKNVESEYTVRKFQDFSASQILRESNFKRVLKVEKVPFRASKNAIMNFW